MLLMLFTAPYGHQWAYFTAKIHKWTLTLFLPGNRHKRINLAHGTWYTVYVGRTKKIEEKMRRLKLINPMQKGEMMNDFVEWLIMCVELIKVIIEINICFLWRTRSLARSPFSMYITYIRFPSFAREWMTLYWFTVNGYAGTSTLNDCRQQKIKLPKR